MKKLLIILALLLVFSLSVYGKQPIPFLEITQPKNGDYVQGIVPISFHAKGYDLSNSTISLSGDGWGIGVIPECMVKHDIETGLDEMYCHAEWNSVGHEGENIIIQASVQERSGLLQDKVKVLVSGEHV